MEMVLGSSVDTQDALEEEPLGARIKRPWKGVNPLVPGHRTSYSSRLVIREGTIDYQTQLGEHLN